MRNPNRIHEICELLEKVWNYVPDWRLGQLVVNLARHANSYDPFFLEDDKMKQALEEYLAEAEENG